MRLPCLYKEYKNLTFSMLKIFSVLSLTFFSMHATALVLLQQAYVSAGSEYDSNARLSDKDKQSVWRYTAAPRYTVSVVDDNNRWYTDAGLRVQRSSNKTISQDRNDPNVTAGWEREFERGNFSLVGHYAKDTTRFTEFDGTGILDKDGTSTTKSIGANWSYLLTERLNFSVGGQYLNTVYSGGNFTNYVTKSANSTLSYDWNELISPFVQVSFTDFKPDGFGRVATQSQSYSGGANVVLSPRFNFNASVGVNHTTPAGNGWIANSSANYIGERYTVHGTLGRNVSASSIGSFQESDRLLVGYNYDLSEISRLGADFSWRKNKSLNDSETKQISGSYSRDLSDNWKMKLSLQIKNLKNTNQSASANVLGITFTYNTPEF